MDTFDASPLCPAPLELVLDHVTFHTPRLVITECRYRDEVAPRSVERPAPGACHAPFDRGVRPRRA